jgi:hypothetical protein
VQAIVAVLQADPAADVAGLRAEIDELIFDLFEIRGSRDAIRRFHGALGRVGPAQAASE